MGPNHKPNQQNVKSKYTNMNFLIISILFGSLNSSPLVSEFLYFFVFERPTEITFLAANYFWIRLLLIWFQGLKLHSKYIYKIAQQERFMFAISCWVSQNCIINNAWFKYKREDPTKKNFGRAMESWRDYLFLREAFDQIFEVCEPNCSLLQNTGSQI